MRDETIKFGNKCQQYSSATVRCWPAGTTFSTPLPFHTPRRLPPPYLMMTKSLNFVFLNIGWEATSRHWTVVIASKHISHSHWPGNYSVQWLGYGPVNQGTVVRFHVEPDISSPKSPDPLCGPPTLLLEGFRGFLPGGKASHVMLSTAKVKNEWSYTFTPPCFRGVDRDNHTFAVTDVQNFVSFFSTKVEGCNDEPL
jgi:hypothetical protein